MERFEDADKRYNSGLFDFRKDTVTPSLKIDDKLLSDILSELYPPKSPYEFSVIGIEILGEVYEQFLGKVIRLTAGHQAKVEEKPEVRKAGGVHYTPQYIVSYIVKNTVGKPSEDGPPARLTISLPCLELPSESLSKEAA
jgi:type I restriction-modification system DNA methylase subunit